jgi:filamentous hemagglutinin family protein
MVARKYWKALRITGRNNYSIKLFWLAGLSFAAILLSSRYAIAQVSSDGTTNTSITATGNNFQILNGTEKGNNLFHSFSNFSVPTGGSARFDLVNTPNITTIFSRVTGGNTSNIDGLIQTLNSNNPVSLFLINPNGIIFGQNAKLDISGSFYGATAKSIVFQDGSQFSAINYNRTPLLTMSIPVGLQMGDNSGDIIVQGNGHNLVAQDAIFSPYINRGSSSVLQVKPGKTFALVGEDIQLNGANIQAEAGNVELVSLRGGEVELVQTSKDFSIEMMGISQTSSNRGDIKLSQKSLLDVSGAGNSSIKIHGDRVTIEDGSVVMMQNRGIQPAGDITVNANSLFLTGAIPTTQIRSSLMSETLGGDSANINIYTKSLKIADGGSLFNRTFGRGNNGEINIYATQSIEVTGVVKTNPYQFSAIGSVTFSPGNSGDIQISTRNLSVLDGGIITATTLSSGSAGSININSENIQVADLSTGIFEVSTITASTFGKGNAGNININTQNLSVRDSASINTVSHNDGNSGSININATNSIELDGGNSVRSADISASVIPEKMIIGRLLKLPQSPSGNAGNIVINTPYLRVSNLGNLGVRSAGAGKAGELKVEANLIELENIGRFVARSNSGKGGNIFITADLLRINDNSLITTNASGAGNGGNITIDLHDALIMGDRSQIDTESLSSGNGGNIKINSPVIVGLENSDISANAVKGNGGNINITTQGIFGLKYRHQRTDNSDITASSQLGVNGTVDINNFGVTPNSGVVELPTQISDPSQQIATGCIENSNNSFIATGRGGIPENPNQQIRSDRTWSDVRDISNRDISNRPLPNQVSAQLPQTLPQITEIPIQATSWRKNSQGEIELIAESPLHLTQKTANCHQISQE